MDINIDINMENQNNPPDQLTSESQAPVSNFSAKKRRFPVILGIALLFLTVGGIYYLNRNQSNPQSQSQQIVTPSASALPKAPKPVSYQKTEATSPDQFGFTKLLKMKGIGVQAQFPQNVNLSFQQENFYVAKVGQDTVTFELKNYDGGGSRRAWFQKEYPYYKDYNLIMFNGGDHSGYIAYSKTPQGNNPGSYFYFTAVNSNKMLVIHGINYDGNAFFGGNLDKFKSFLSTVELTAAQNIGFETFPQVSDLYRWSDTRKTLWEDANLGLKITVPEWIESRYAKEKDSEGKFPYTDWKRTYPEAKSYESSYFSENIKRIEVTGGYISSQTLSILSSKYQDKSFSEVASELLIPAGFCTTEWKNSKTECAGSEYCYTKDEVIKNLVVKKQIKIGTLDAQLRNMNQDFSIKNDCRAEDIWLIKAKNSQFVLSDIFPDTETVRLEGI